jgi:hypothetical protein
MTQFCACHFLSVTTESVQTPRGLWLVRSLVHEYVFTQSSPKSPTLTSLPVVGWVAILFTLPETKALTLEELDLVFSVPTIRHAKYQLKNSIWHFRRYVLFQRNLKPLAPLYETKDLVSS